MEALAWRLGAFPRPVVVAPAAAPCMHCATRARAWRPFMRVAPHPRGCALTAMCVWAQVTRPVAADGVVYAGTGFNNKTLSAIRTLSTSEPDLRTRNYVQLKP